MYVLNILNLLIGQMKSGEDWKKLNQRRLELQWTVVTSSTALMTLRSLFKLLDCLLLGFLLLRQWGIERMSGLFENS